MVDVILGAQWGDEGKGRYVDELAQRYDVVARFNGGGNAGHTIVIGDKVHKLHILPSGIFYDHVTCLIGNGVLIDLLSLYEEIQNLEKLGINVKSRIKISSNAHLVFGCHRQLDCYLDEKLKIGTTKKGIGIAMATKAFRNGIRIGEMKNIENFKRSYYKLNYFVMKLMDQSGDFNTVEFNALINVFPYFENMLVDSVSYLNHALIENKRILAEGANAAMLDPDHGTYPFVTSTTTTIGGVCSGLGISSKSISQIYGVIKAYVTRVGEGPFITELLEEDGKHISQKGKEFGTTTGRPRRCGWFDVLTFNYSNILNGYSAIFMNKIDVLSGMKIVKICYAYKHVLTKEIIFEYSSELNLWDYEPIYQKFRGWGEIGDVTDFHKLPSSCIEFINFIEEKCKTKIIMIGVGPVRNRIIRKVVDLQN